MRGFALDDRRAIGKSAACAKTAAVRASENFARSQRSTSVQTKISARSNCREDIAAIGGAPRWERDSQRELRVKSLPEFVQQALHHGRFMALRELDKVQTLDRISSPEAADRDQQIQIWPNLIWHGRR